MKTLTFIVAVLLIGMGVFVFAGTARGAVLCNDIDENGVINEIDCGDSINDSCSSCFSPTACRDVDENQIINEIDCGDSVNDNCSRCFLPVDNSGQDNPSDFLPVDNDSQENPSYPDDYSPNRGGPLGDFPGEDLDFEDLISIMTGLACWLGRVASLGAVIFVIWAGLRFMAARGDPKAFTDAVTNLKRVLLGILVIYGVYVIIATVANAVG